MAGGGVDHHARGLVYHEQVGVLIEHGEGDGLSLQAARLGGWDVDGDVVVGFQLVGGFGDRGGIDTDMAALY
jgi:hypothetical protein